MHTRKKVGHSLQKPAATKNQDGGLQAKSQRVTVNPTKSVKFAISSSLQTSNPVTYAKREPHKPVGSYIQPPKIVTSHASRDSDQTAGATTIATTATTPLSRQETASHSTGALDSNYLSYGISDVLNRQSTSSYTNATPASDFDAVSEESSVLLHDQSVGHSSSGSRASIELDSHQSKSESSIGEVTSDHQSLGSLSAGEEDASKREIGDEIKDLVVTNATRETVEETSRQSTRLTLEIDMQFSQQDEEHSSERLSSVYRPSTVHSSDAEPVSVDEGERRGKSLISSINSEYVLEDSDGLEKPQSLDESPKGDADYPEKLLPFSESAKASSEGIDIVIDDTERRRAQQDSVSNSVASSDHTLKAESEPELHEALPIPSTEEEPEVNPSSVPPEGHSCASSSHASSSKRSSKESSFYMHSLMKGDMSDILTGNHMFSESVSTLGLTFSIPSRTRFSETSSSPNLSSQVRDETPGVVDVPHSRLNIDHMFESSEHHLMTSSWLEDVNAGSTPSSLHSVPRTDLSSQSSHADGKYGHKEKVESEVYAASQPVSSSEIAAAPSCSAKESGDDAEGVNEGVDDNQDVDVGDGGEELGGGGNEKEDGEVGGAEGGGGDGGEGGGGGDGDSDRGDVDSDASDSSSTVGNLSVDDDILRMKSTSLDDADHFDGAQVEGSLGKIRAEKLPDTQWDMNRAMENLLEGKKDAPMQTLAVSCILSYSLSIITIR